jgi:isoleucyl-tRNA synthetase
VLDTAITPELAAEGTARDVVRVVQQARRDAGLDVADRIELTVDGQAAVLDAVRAHEAFVAGEVLAVSVAYGAGTDGAVPEPTLRGTVATPDGTSAEIAALVTRA